METMMETMIASVIVGLMGVLAGMLYKASVIERMQEDYQRQDRTLWQAVNRIGDECDILRAMIYTLEQKLKEREDDWK